MVPFIHPPVMKSTYSLTLKANKFGSDRQHLSRNAQGALGAFAISYQRCTEIIRFCSSIRHEHEY